MKASLFCTGGYIGPAPHDVWPLPAKFYSPEQAIRSMQVTMEQFRCADTFGFEHVLFGSP